MSGKTIYSISQELKKKIFSVFWKQTSNKVNVIMERYNSSVPSFLLPNRLKWLTDVAPAFPLHGSQIKVLTQPDEFYKELVSRASKSTDRILLTTLYLGIGKLEENLVSTIEEQMEKCETLKVRWLIDYTRGSRGSYSSRSILLPMIKNNPENCQVTLYHTPDLRGFMRKLIPQRWNEVIGLQHMKLYIFDDSIIISGANLSNDYFTNRQDRYIIFENCKELVDFYENIVETVSHYSFKLLPDNTTAMYPLSGVHPLLGEKRTYCNIVNRTITNLWYEECEKSRQRLRQLEQDSQSENVPSLPDTLVFPTLQMGPFNINYDGFITKQILSDSDESSTIKLASGYFNLTEEYMKSVLNESKNKFDILCAHPKANGFLGAKGFAGFIPDGYTQIAKSFFNRVSSSQQNIRIKLHEYEKNGWTFHGKGLWLYLSQNTYPLLTMIGSPNFGYRSKSRDLECQALVVTQNRGLQKLLHAEQENLYKPSSLVQADTYKDKSRSVPFWVQFVMPIIKAFF